MRLFFKLSLILISFIFIICVAFLSIKSGDFLIDYLAKSLGFEISYRNRCGFVSAFIWRKAYLKSPVLKTMDDSLEIKCKNANIRFDYTKLLTKQAIGLHCRFIEPVLTGRPPPENKEKSFIDFLPTVIFSMLGETTNFKYDDMVCDLLIYGETAEVHQFTATSRDIILKAKGLLTYSGQIDLELMALFSPGFIEGLGEQAAIILEEDDGGWMSFKVKIKTSEEGGPFLKLESERFKLSITEGEETEE